MGVPAAVLGDRIQGICPAHLIPGPQGAPVKAPPMPFSAPLVQGVAPKVLIQGKPAAVVGSWGVNLPPHVGLHGADPHMAGPAQIGRVIQGSATVLIEGKPAAKMGVTGTMCHNLPLGKVVATAATVLIGG